MRSLQNIHRQTSMQTKKLALVMVLIAISTFPVSSAPDLVAALSTATNHYEWARLSREIDKQGVTVGKTNAAAFVRHQLVRLNTAGFKEREAITAEIVALGPQAMPTLIAAITNAARPAPIFGDSAVANIPIFSMQLLAKMRSEQAVPALIDFIDKFETDVILRGPDGKPQNQVVSVLTAITGQDFGTDKSKWRRWYEERQSAGK